MVEARGVAPVAAVVLTFPAGTQRDHCCLSKKKHPRYYSLEKISFVWWWWGGGDYEYRLSFQTPDPPDLKGAAARRPPLGDFSLAASKQAAAHQPINYITDYQLSDLITSTHQSIHPSLTPKFHIQTHSSQIKSESNPSSNLIHDIKKSKAKAWCVACKRQRGKPARCKSVP